ncbi:hypothetical protein BDW22DRAFT_1333606, partial [Trametopsis cervina]
IFASSTQNFSPRVQTYEHVDQVNKVNEICPIISSGTFDTESEGHLILQDLNLLVEFSPGCMMLILSSTLMHSNVEIQPEKCCKSSTLFTAGGLFC